MDQNQILASPPSELSNIEKSNSIANAYIIIFVFIFLFISISIVLALLHFHRRNNDQSTPDETTILENTPNNTRNENERSESNSGLHKSIIERFPILKANEVKELKEAKGFVECTVCLSEFEDHENLRKLPGCCHVFHVDCIEPWFMSQVTCPVCRVDLKDYHHVSVSPV
ncbi:hypothetical protein LUZ60_005717 [Juncus effusus]|nr:hypothetical protein LUZ60_005717 [Juncus effusus]